MSSMKDKAFLDTNILVYAIDSDPAGQHKRREARELVHEHIVNRSGVISVQVMQEFFVTATRKIANKLSVDESLEFLSYISVLEIVYPDEHLVFSAARKIKHDQISFWDAMIIHSARISGCTTLLSEDLQSGSEIDGVKIINPFCMKMCTRC